MGDLRKSTDCTFVPVHAGDEVLTAFQCYESFDASHLMWVGRVQKKKEIDTIGYVILVLSAPREVIVHAKCFNRFVANSYAVEATSGLFH